MGPYGLTRIKPSKTFVLQCRHDNVPHEALSLLNKWKEEKLLIHAVITVTKNIGSSVVGRIKELTQDIVLIESGAHTGMRLDLSAATNFQFEDERLADDPIFALDEKTAEDVRQCYEGFLVVSFAGFFATLQALRPSAEIDAL